MFPSDIEAMRNLMLTMYNDLGALQKAGELSRLQELSVRVALPGLWSAAEALRDFDEQDEEKGRRMLISDVDAMRDNIVEMYERLHKLLCMEVMTEMQELIAYVVLEAFTVIAELLQDFEGKE
jgi:(p)ppGpp synthase/HD superfamily hydrolase